MASALNSAVKEEYNQQFKAKIALYSPLQSEDSPLKISLESVLQTNQNNQGYTTSQQNYTSNVTK